MNLTLIRFWPLLGILAAALLPTSALAGVQTQLDVLAESECTILDGRLFIWPSYEGPFVLRHVQNITGSIRAFPSNDEPNVTAIELPDLLYMGTLSSRMSTLTTLSAPNLVSAENIEIWRPTTGGMVDLSRLRSVDENLQLAGDFSRIATTSLQNVGALTICNKWCETAPEWDDAEAQALDVDLPSLETAGQLSLVGNISRFVLSTLSIAARPQPVHELDEYGIDHVPNIAYRHRNCKPSPRLACF
ncbi:hypothetical protein BDW72DRAFT_191667 [Aspergillus terricola var. indicus]